MPYKWNDPKVQTRPTLKNPRSKEKGLYLILAGLQGWGVEMTSFFCQIKGIWVAATDKYSAYYIYGDANLQNEGKYEL